MAPGRVLRGLGWGLQAIGVVALVATFLGTAVTSATTARYSGRDYCLALTRGAVAYTTQNRAVNRVLPFFAVPAPIPTSSILDDVAATGLDVRYSKWHSGGFRIPDLAACPSTDGGNGLRRFQPREYGKDGVPMSCPGAHAHEVLLPMSPDPLAGQVRIYCALDPVVPNCTMDDRMPNGWQAGISLPRTHVADWRAASVAARAYFNENLWDCGTD